MYILKSNAGCFLQNSEGEHEMTIKKAVVLWDNGVTRLCLLPVPSEQEYKYIDGCSCITFGISYENEGFKGFDIFTLFDPFYSKTIANIKNTYTSLNGTIRMADNGADTDGYIEFVMKNGIVFIKGQLGASFSSHSLTCAFEADQTLIGSIIQAIEL